MNWEDKFTDSELEFGFKSYINGNIRSVTKRGEHFIVKFGGYDKSTVTVTKTGDDYTAECDCWESRYYGRGCHHIVPSIYAVTKPVAMYHTDNSPVSNITDDIIIDKNEYHYFDIKGILNSVNISEEAKKEAKRLIEAGEIHKQSSKLINYYPSNDASQKYYGIEFIAELNQEGKKFPISITVTKNEFWRAKCFARRCFCEYDIDPYASRNNSRRLCQHIAAGILLLKDFVIEENPGDITDYKAMQLLGRYRRQSRSVSEKNANIFLLPELQNDDGEFRVAFKIGIDKPYKVKNLTELVSKAQNNETLTLGKNNSINFSLCDFNDKSKPLFEFIESKVRDNEQRNERLESRARWGYMSRLSIENITDSVPLDATGLDEFYEICTELTDFDYSRKEYRRVVEKSRMKCATGKPRLKIKLTEITENKQTAGVRLTGSLPELAQGIDGIYFTDGKLFYKSSKEDYMQIKPFIDLANESGSLDFKIGRRSIADFYRNVYPMLSEIADIVDTATANVEKLIPPEPDVVFYLDSIDNVLSCKSEVIYDDKKHSPMESFAKNMFSQIYRDYNKEHDIANTVARFFPDYDSEKGESLCVDPELGYLVYREGVDELLKLGEIQCTDSFSNRKVRKGIGVKVGVSVESDLLNLDISSTDISQDELASIFESYRLKKKYHVLKSGDFIDLQSEDIQLVNQILSTKSQDIKKVLGKKIQFPLYRALYIDKLLESNDEIYGHRDKIFKQIIKDFGTIKDSDLEIPFTLENTLRKYQQYGHKWIRTLTHNNFGGILADEMGLGKTLQVISVLLAEKTDEPKTSLVVCPASLVYNWKEEFIKFAGNLSVEVVASGAKERHAQIKEYSKYDVIITSYDLLKRDIAEYEECKFEYQIIDEAQYIKNPKTAAAKAVKVINARHKMALTGTPIENRLSELWSIFDFIMPGFLFEYEKFRHDFETPITKNKDEETSSRLKKMIEPFILRRQKKNVLKDLPEKIEENRYGVMDDAQQKLYDSQVMKISSIVKNNSDEDFNKSKIKILAEITRARQLCCDPSLLFEDYKGGSAKREACLELIESAIEGEHRILLFSQFTSMLDILANDLKSRGIDYFMLKGDTSKEQRVKLMKQFNEGDVPVFLVSLKAGGTGLNLTGADIVIHYDPWWNLAVQNQATDRAHRIGQTKNVTVYKLIIKNSIEEKIVKLQEIKKDLADEILSGEGASLSSMTKEDLLALLGE